MQSTSERPIAQTDTTRTECRKSTPPLWVCGARTALITQFDPAMINHVVSHPPCSRGIPRSHSNPSKRETSRIPRRARKNAGSAVSSSHPIAKSTGCISALGTASRYHAITPPAKTASATRRILTTRHDDASKSARSAAVHTLRAVTAAPHSGHTRADNPLTSYPHVRQHTASLSLAAAAFSPTAHPFR